MNLKLKFDQCQYIKYIYKIKYICSTVTQALNYVYSYIICNTFLKLSEFPYSFVMSM